MNAARPGIDAVDHFVRPVSRARLHPVVPVPVFREPDRGQPVALLSPWVVVDWPTWVPVVDGRPGWALVALPWVPYGGSGWVRLDPRVAVVPSRTAVVIDSVRQTVALVERARVRMWSARVARGSLRPRGRTLVLGEVSSGVGGCGRGLLVAAHVVTDDGDGLAFGGAHRWAALVHDSAGVSGGVFVPLDAMDALLGAAPAGTNVHIR